MAIPNYHDFLLGEINADAGRKAVLKLALAKQWGWTAKIIDGDGKEIDNPFTFEEEFNRRTWDYHRGEAVAGKKSLDKEAREAPDTFEDLVS